MWTTWNNDSKIILAPLCIYIYVCNWSRPTGQLELIRRQKRTGLFYLGFMIFYIWNILIAPSSLYLNGSEWDIFNWCSKPRFIYSKEATKFEEISLLFLTLLSDVKTNFCGLLRNPQLYKHPTFTTCFSFDYL